MGELTRDQVAEIVGVTADTFSGYVSRGQAPQPARRIARTPLWDEDEVHTWHQTRPGRGARSTDRALRRAEERAQKQAQERAGSDQVDDTES